jgi:DNA-binding NarL/FixJ family response regulator
MVHVMIVDDQEMIREGLRAILSTQDGIEVVAAAGDGLSAIASIAQLQVDVVLMDIRMPGINGVETTRRLRELYSAEALRIIVLTTFDNDENVLAALRAGANGFLSKGVGPTQLAEGIREVADGGGTLSAAATAVLIGQVANDKRPIAEPAVLDRFATLTAREREVVIDIATGLDNAQIAEKLFVSPFTVKTHATRAMNKVGARDRAQLVSLVYRAGLAS